MLGGWSSIQPAGGGDKLGKEGCFSTQAWAPCSQSSKENQDSCRKGEWSFLISCSLNGANETDAFGACGMRFPNCCFPQT